MDALGKIIGGVVMGWLLAQIADIWKRRRERKADAAYLGATVLIQLERLMHGCASVAGDDGTACGRPAGRTDDGEEYYVAQTKTPGLSWDGIKVDWKSIDPLLMYTILSIPLELDEVKDNLQGVSEYDDPPYDRYIAERQLRFAELGVMVADLAKQLRLATGVPTRPAKEWNPESYMRERLRELRDLEEKLAAERLKSWPHLLPSEAPVGVSPVV
ncbi:hypothetical protein [Xanthomonas campestris]|uniref:hypothetical protein n=2 Tax=Xanthomonas campestris TaxID=339 RepID=UPI0011157F33|nr:hypothetical protein [Xanthomonas campestris]MEA9482794.1 hypothetical protein [Xanthomonas campestris]WDJ89902.1 hypothetical protein JH302_00355 [Xanthomonas campestris]WVL60936.1 hypothetical protein LLE68_000370 [Xanthomonas campestris pv. barbareae]